MDTLYYLFTNKEVNNTFFIVLPYFLFLLSMVYFIKPWGKKEIGDNLRIVCVQCSTIFGMVTLSLVTGHLILFGNG